MSIRVTHVLWLDEGPGRPSFGGAENHLMILLPALARVGIDVELLVLLWRSGPLIEDRLAALERRGVRVVRLQMNRDRSWRWGGLRLPAHVIALRDALRTRRERIIHLHLDFAIQPLAAKLAGCRQTVMSIHNDEQWFATRLNRLRLRRIDRWVEGYIAISERIRGYYASVAGVDPAKITTIHYGLEPARDAVARDEVRRRFALPPDAFVIGFAGRLTHQKNVPLLIEAVRRTPDVVLAIFGEGELGESLRASAAALPQVHFLGYQPDVDTLFPGLDVFCLPSRFEGLGLVLIEAMRRGVPIIASRAGAIPEILEDGRYGVLFDSEDLEGLVNAIGRVKSDPASRRAMAEAAVRYSRETFTVERMAESTAAFYGSLGQTEA